MAVQTEDGEIKMTTKLERIGKRAAYAKETVFNNIGCVIDLDMLRESYHELPGNKAIGIEAVAQTPCEIT